MVARQYRRIETSRILTPTGGYLSGYTHTLNPYVGCAFACDYCYVRKLPVALFRKQEWGRWTDGKYRSEQLLSRELAWAKLKGPVTIFMSSATDPYQPEEYRERITRRLLEALAEDPPDRLWVQTRSPLVTRDADLLSTFGDRVRISMTVETDLESVRRKLTPHAPPIAARLRAMRAIKEQGLDVQATVAPILPSSDAFPKQLAAAADRVGLDDLLTGDGAGGKRSERLGMRQRFQEYGWESWYEHGALQAMRERMLACFPPDKVRTGQEAFLF